MSRTQRLWLLYGTLALACAGSAMALVLTSNHEEHKVTALFVGEILGLSFIVAGLLGTTYRPANATGRLLAFVGFAFCAGALAEANNAVPYTIGSVVGVVWVAAFVHLLVAYPTGTLARGVDRKLVISAYALALAYPLLYLPFSDPPDCKKGCPGSVLLVHESDTAAIAVEALATVSAIAVMVGTIVLLARRWRRASVAYRRSLRLVLVTGGVAVGLLLLELAVEPLLPTAGDVVIELPAAIAFVCVPFAFAFGLLRSRRAGAAVGRLVADLGPSPAPGQLRDAMREVLGDPALELGYWLPDLPGFVDIEGRPFDPHERGSATLVEGEAGRIGVLVHDAALLDERELLDGVVAAARLALENERLHAELRAQLAELERERDFTRLVVDTAPALHCVVDADGAIVGLNDRALDVSGVADPDELLGLPFWSIFAPEEAEDVRGRLGLVAMGQPPEVFEHTVVSRNGERRRIEWRAATVPDPRRQLELVILAGLDVTDRRWHEDVQAALRRFATLVATEPSVDEVLTAVTENVGKLFAGDISNIARLEGETARIIGGWSARGGRYEPGRTFRFQGTTATAQSLRTGMPRRATLDDPHDEFTRGLWAELGIRAAIAAPIIVEGTVWGAISVSLTRDATFVPDAEQRLADFAALVAQAIVNAEARRTLAVVAQEQAALRRVATLVAEGAGQDELLTAVTTEIGSLFGAQSANTMRWDGDSVRVLGGWNAPGEQTNLPGRVFAYGGDTVTARVVQTGAPARINSREDLQTEIARQRWEDLGLHATIGAPVVVDGRVWGVVTASRTHPDDPFPEGAEQRLGDFAALVAQAIANAGAQRDLAGLADEQAALRRVATLVAAGRSRAEVLAAVTREAGELFGATTVNLVRWEGVLDEIVVVGGWSDGSEPPIPPRTRFHPEHDGVTIRVLETGFASRGDEASPEFGRRCVIASPVIVSAALWGALAAMRHDGDNFPPEAEVRLRSFADLMAQSIANSQAQEELRASRARIVNAADEARQRLERNLHDGAQQRLVAVSISLRLAIAKLHAAPDDARPLLDSAAEELTHAIDELRELARGIHPAILTDRGLGPALEALAGRAPLPVAVEHDLDDRLPPPVEAAAYYVVSESLTNIAKYARASEVEVRVSRRDGVARVDVVDDGVGGADPTRGSGLRGLADRVEALDGRLGVESPPAEGTRVWAEIPVV
jgi:PAS domain S-box-containing protein